MRARPPSIRRSLQLLLCAVTLIPPACGPSGSTGPGGPGGGDPLNPAEMQGALLTAFCKWSARCGVIGASQEADCVTSAGSLRRPLPYDPAEAVAAGRVAWDGGAAARCVRSVEQSACGSFGILATGECTMAIVGRVPIGGACKGASECDGGWCDQGTTGRDGCPGTCRAFLPTAAACLVSVQCGPTSYCDREMGRCAATVAVGGACHQQDACGPGRVCGGNAIGLGSRAGVCALPAVGKEGAACTPGFAIECAPDHYCDPSGGSGAVCRPRPGAGAVCQGRFDCAAALACAFDARDGQQRCVPIADVGGACDPAGAPLSTACALDLACDGYRRACVARPSAPTPVGQACNADAACGDSTLYCKARRCAVRPVFGEACEPGGGQGGTDACFDSVCNPDRRTCVLSCG